MKQIFFFALLLSACASEKPNWPTTSFSADSLLISGVGDYGPIGVYRFYDSQKQNVCYIVLGNNSQKSISCVKENAK